MSKKSKRNRRPEPCDDQKATLISRRWSLFAASALIIIVCLLTYSNSMQFGLTGLDDDVLLNTFSKQTYQIKDALVRDAFMAEKSDSFYRPLQSLTFMADSYFWGSNPISYHRTNVILHCIAACCLLQLLLLLGYPQTLSIMATLVYTANPIFAQAVSWIPGRGDLLLGIFGILSFFFWVKFCSVRKPHYLFLHFLAFSLAALSKETALVLPVIFAAYLLFVERKKALSVRNLPPVSVWIMVAVAYYFIRRIAMYRLPGSQNFGLARLIENLRVLPENVGSFIAPFNISVLPSFSLQFTLIGLAGIATIVTVLRLQGKQGKPLVILGCLWFVLLSIPGMMYRQEFGRFGYNYLNHRAYLPMIGILWMLIEAVPGDWLAPRRKQFYLAGGGVVVLLCILAYHQSANFADAQTFYSQAIKTNPQSALAYNHRGKFKADAGNFKSAMIDYDNAVRLYPNYPLAFNNRAETKGALRDYQGALDDLNKALALDPGNAVFYSNRGRWYESIGRDDAALADYNQGIRLNPGFPGNYNNRGALKAKKEDLDGAVADFEAAIQRDPMLGDAIFNLGLIQMRRGNKSSACNQWLSAAQIQHARARQALQEYCR
jgi:protein O-mannosyl-transferase